MPNITLAREGTQFSDPDGQFSIGWPHGGKREIVKLKNPSRIVQRRIVEGFLEETSKAANVEAEPLASYSVLTGEEARKKLKEPPAEKVTFAAAVVTPGKAVVKESAEDKDDPAGLFADVPDDDIDAIAKILGVEGGDRAGREAGIRAALEERGADLSDEDSIAKTLNEAAHPTPTGPELVDDSPNREDLNKIAEAEGVENPAGLANKGEVVDAINAKRKAAWDAEQQN